MNVRQRVLGFFHRLAGTLVPGDRADAIDVVLVGHDPDATNATMARIRRYVDGRGLAGARLLVANSRAVASLDPPGWTILHGDNAGLDWGGYQLGWDNILGGGSHSPVVMFCNDRTAHYDPQRSCLQVLGPATYGWVGRQSVVVGKLQLSETSQAEVMELPLPGWIRGNLLITSRSKLEELGGPCGDVPAPECLFPDETATYAEQSASLLSQQYRSSLDRWLGLSPTTDKTWYRSSGAHRRELDAKAWTIVAEQLFSARFIQRGGALVDAWAVVELAAFGQPIGTGVRSQSSLRRNVASGLRALVHHPSIG